MSSIKATGSAWVEDAETEVTIKALSKVSRHIITSFYPDTFLPPPPSPINENGAQNMGWA